jgi:hypothetical protein
VLESIAVRKRKWKVLDVNPLGERFKSLKGKGILKRFSALALLTVLVFTTTFVCDARDIQPIAAQPKPRPDVIQLTGLELIIPQLIPWRGMDFHHQAHKPTHQSNSHAHCVFLG